MTIINNDLKHNMTEQHKNELNESIHLHRLLPVLNKNNEVRPLNDATLIDDAQCGVLICFDMDPNNILPVEKYNHVKAKHFDEYSFTTKNGNSLP